MMSMRVATEGASHDDCPCEGEEDGPSTCPGDDPAKQESRHARRRSVSETGSYVAHARAAATGRTVHHLFSGYSRSASAYRSEHASLNGKRGSRGCSEGGSPYPRLQRKFVLTCPSAKNSCSQPKHGLPAAKNSSSTLA